MELRLFVIRLKTVVWTYWVTLRNHRIGVYYQDWCKRSLYCQQCCYKKNTRLKYIFVSLHFCYEGGPYDSRRLQHVKETQPLHLSA